MELDFGLVTILCKGSEQCELSGVVQGIPMELREVSFVWSQDCCDLRCGRLDDTLFIGYVSSWKYRPLAKLTSLIAFELRAGEKGHSKIFKKTRGDIDIY